MTREQVGRIANQKVEEKRGTGETMLQKKEED